MTWPVIYDDKSDAKKTHTLATSLGLPDLLRGMFLIQSAVTDSDNLSVISVTINPGAITLQRIFLEPSSRAIDFEKPIIPDFEAA